MEYKKTFKVDFYELTCPTGKFEDYVNNAGKDQFLKKNFHLPPYEIILDVFEDQPAYLAGHMVKVRMNDIDPKYNTTDFSTEAMPLEEDEGIPAGVVWLYLKSFKLLFIQSTFAGVHPNQFCWYFENLAFTGKLHLKVILSEEGFKKLNSFDYISKVDIAIKGLEHAGSLKDAGSTKAILKKFTEMETNNLEITISKGRRAKGLSLDTVKQFVRDLRGVIGDEGHGHIKVTGRHGDEEDLKPIDLLVSRYRRDFSIDVQAGQRLNSSLSANAKLIQLKAMINDVSQDLKNYFDEDH
jgi:hypothetical protein